MKRKLFLILLLGCVTLIAVAQQSNPTTARFEFYNDFWINLHHYLYQQAKGSQERHLNDIGQTLLDVGEIKALANFRLEETARLERAVAYYREHLIGKNLRRDLGDIRIWLQQQSDHEHISETSFSAAFTQVLNEAASVYRSALWPLHQEQNALLLKRHLENIKSMETAVISRMEELAHNKWPDVPFVRVDLTAYANYAGAYTASEPELNIFISSLDSLNTTNSFIETVFHEGCHLLYGFQDSPFRGAIYNTSKEMGLEFPRGLWHASLFYLCGRVVQDQLVDRDLSLTLLMDALRIYSDYNTPEFRAIWEAYYQGEYDMEHTVDKLLEVLSASE